MLPDLRKRYSAFQAAARKLRIDNVFHASISSAATLICVGMTRTVLGVDLTPAVAIQLSIKNENRTLCLTSKLRIILNTARHQVLSCLTS